MEIKGKVLKILPELTGEGKNGTWTKRSFIIETEGQYPKLVQISAFGNKMNVDAIKFGNHLNVHFNLESREYNDRYYTEVSAYKIELIGSTQSGNMDIKQPVNTSNAIIKSEDDDDLPF